MQGAGKLGTYGGACAPCQVHVLQDQLHMQGLLQGQLLVQELVQLQDLLQDQLLVQGLLQGQVLGHQPNQ